MYSAIPDPWTRPNVFPRMQMGTIQNIPQPVGEVGNTIGALDNFMTNNSSHDVNAFMDVNERNLQRLLPPAANTPAMFPNDGPLNIPNTRMRNLGIAAAIGVPLVAGAALAYNHFSKPSPEEDKANALLNHHLRG